ncbi:hypothetical protein AWF13_08415 [Escherichia coli]|nr:hypothetical protein AWF13_08415 [Escherichia coli]
MKPQVYHVDAFTSQPFRGNSAGVVFPADNLSEAQMQLIARELGHSETAFLLHSDVCQTVRFPKPNTFART